MERRLKKIIFSITLTMGLMLSFCNVSIAQKLPTPVEQQNSYIPSFDIAEYALHQGEARSANLIEGFVPLYQSAPNILTFVDIRFYNPNGTPLEGNIDLGFRRLFPLYY